MKVYFLLSLLGSFPHFGSADHQMQYLRREQSCTVCTDSPTDYMVNTAGKDCETGTWFINNRCNKDDNWEAAKTCQKSCYDAGFGYQGDVCCDDPDPPILCTVCDDVPDNYMINTAGKDCETGTWFINNRCNKSDNWKAAKTCQKSCYDAGFGYEGDVCCDEPEPPSCTVCTDIPTDYMVNNAGEDCETGTWFINNRCNKSTGWQGNKFCQKSCYDAGFGYEGDVCCDEQPLPTEDPTAGPTNKPTSGPTGSPNDSMAEAWLEAHNSRRTAYHTSRGKTPSLLEWSPSLAAEAQSYADLLVSLDGCVFNHASQLPGDFPFGDFPRTPNTPEGQIVGENLAAGQTSPEGVLQGWWDSEANIGWGTEAYAANGHFITAAYYDTKYVGCGQASRSVSGCLSPVYVCRYVRGSMCPATNADTWEDRIIDETAKCGAPAAQCPQEVPDCD